MEAGEALVDSYLAWVKARLTTETLGDWIRLTTPFLDRHNDFMEIFVKVEGDQLTLTDDGYVLNDLEQSGCAVTSGRRKDLLEQILNGHGVSLHQDELIIQANMTNFAQRKHLLLQAMLAVNDLFLTSRPIVRGLFLEEVEQFLTVHQVRSVPNFQLAGKSGLSHAFDFAVPAWGEAPERLIKTLNRPSKEKITSLLFAWSDTRAIRRRPVQLFAFMNDQDRSVSSALVEACHSEGVEVVRWSAKEQYLPVLTA